MNLRPGWVATDPDAAPLRRRVAARLGWFLTTAVVATSAPALAAPDRVLLDLAVYAAVAAAGTAATVDALRIRAGLYADNHRDDMFTGEESGPPEVSLGLELRRERLAWHQARCQRLWDRAVDAGAAARGELADALDRTMWDYAELLAELGRRADTHHPVDDVAAQISRIDDDVTAALAHVDGAASRRGAPPTTPRLRRRVDLARLLADADAGVGSRAASP